MKNKYNTKTKKNRIGINCNHNYTKYKLNRSLLIILLSITIFSFSAKFAIAQLPQPHNVDGRVFTDDSQTVGVPGDLLVKINDTVSGDLVITYTIDPGPPVLKGRYSATVNGNDNDLVIVTSWNSTHYGMSNTTLLPTTTTIDVVYNHTRDSEPNVTIIIPNNNSIRNTANVFNITANITILGNDGTNCIAIINFSNNVANITSDQSFTKTLGDISLHDFRATIWNVTGIKEGTLNITVKAQCDSDGINLESTDSYTINMIIEDTSGPIVNLINPINNTWLNKDITFEYNISEGTGVENCSLYFDTQLNQTSYSLEVNRLLNFTLNNTPEGYHDWSIYCYDNSSNFNQGNSLIFNINIDDTSPNVTLLFPINNTVMRNYTILFQYNVTDNFNASSCSLIINDKVVQTNDTIIQNISNNFTYTQSGGNHDWYVNCSDNANNIGASSYFTLKTPDLKVNSSDIVFSFEPTSEKQRVEINATIFNIGPVNTTKNVTVQFFENDPDISGVQLGNNLSINVTVGENVTVSINYTTRIGKVGIFVVVDPPFDTNGSIIESNENNNKANRSINIPVYHIFYGEIISDIFLDTSSNLTVVAWLNSTDFEGNIFVADSDSNIDFNSLQALSRNTSNNLTIDDFEELDFLLNTTNLTDSINRSYTQDGSVNNIDNFTVFSSKIIDVPIINSTNTSNFITGIIWDTSDFDSIGFYNGSQDIIFITKTNRNSIGFYGNYDFEIKIPANLRGYVTPNVQDSISFYREIT